MKRTNIDLDEDQARMIRHLAVEEGRSFTDLVREALNEYLLRRGIAAASQVSGPPRKIPESEWRARFEAALECIPSSAPKDLSPEQIEEEITAVRKEVR